MPTDVVVCLPAADANILINSCRLAAQQYLFAYQEPIPVDQLVRSLCDQKQVRPMPATAYITRMCSRKHRKLS